MKISTMEKFKPSNKLRECWERNCNFKYGGQERPH